MKLEDALLDIRMELGSATAHFPPFRSPHEGLAIILEEYEELKAVVFQQHSVRTTTEMREEAKQIAAMALRFMIDLT